MNKVVKKNKDPEKVINVKTEKENQFNFSSVCCSSQKEWKKT